MYDKEKVRKFHEYTLEDYNSSYEINEIVNVKLVEKTDGSFTQIGIRPLIEEDIFIDPSFSEYLPGAGRMVAVGEMDFLINTILNNKEIKRIEVKKDRIEEFPKYIEFDGAIILLSNKFYVETFTKLMRRIDYKEKYPRLDYRYKIIVVSERILENEIIILDKKEILWEKELFYNKETNKKETLDINIKPAKELGKADITIRSVNKIKYLDSKLITILEVEE